MSLAPAQLGQLPYMQLGSRPNNQVIQPAWHKALTAFLVNTAGNTGTQLVGNALAQDYSKQAAAAGVPGVDGSEQAFLDKLLHGPRTDKTALREGMRDVTESKRYAAQDQRYQDQLSLEQQKLKETIAARGEDRASREAMSAENLALRKQQLEQQAYQNSMTAEDRRQQFLEKFMAQQANAPLEADYKRAQITRALAEAKALEAGLDPMAVKGKAYSQQAGKSAASMEQIEALMSKFGNPQPSNNSDTVRPHNQGPTPSVPGGKPAVSEGGVSERLQQFLQTLSAPPTRAEAVPGATPAPVSDILQRRAPGVYDMLQRLNGPVSTPIPMPPSTSVGPETQPNAAPAAGTSQQMGQSAAETPAGSPDYEDAPLTQEQPLVQHVGADLMSLVRPPQTPNSPTAIQPSSGVNNPQPTPMSPEAYALAAEFARRMGLALGMGSTPGQAGSGGLPLGYG